MKNLVRAAAVLTTAALSFVGLSLTSAPANAYTWAQFPTTQKAEVQLDHTDLVSIYNDPYAAGRICGEMLKDVDDMQVLAAPVHIFNCAIDLTYCTQYAVTGGQDHIYVTWTPEWRTCTYVP